MARKKTSPETASASSTSNEDPTELIRKRCKEVLSQENTHMPNGEWHCPQCGDHASMKHWVADHILQHLGTAAGYRPQKPVEGSTRFQLIELD